MNLKSNETQLYITIIPITLFVALVETTVSERIIILRILLTVSAPRGVMLNCIHRAPCYRKKKQCKRRLDVFGVSYNHNYTTLIESRLFGYRNVHYSDEDLVVLVCTPGAQKNNNNSSPYHIIARHRVSSFN